MNVRYGFRDCSNDSNAFWSWWDERVVHLHAPDADNAFCGASMTITEAGKGYVSFDDAVLLGASQTTGVEQCLRCRIIHAAQRYEAQQVSV